MSLYESIVFSEGVIKVAKTAFSLEKLYGRIFLTEFEGKFFASFFPGVFFFLVEKKIHREITPQKLSHRLTPKSVKLTFNQNSIITNREKI